MIGQPLTWSFAEFIGVVGEQNVARRQKGGVEIEDVYRELPTQRHEASHFGPGAIGHEECVRSGVERRSCTEIFAPHSNGAHVSEVFIQHVHHHAQHPREVPVSDLVLEVADIDDGEVLAHDIDGFAPSKRARAGWSSRSMRRPTKLCR